MEHTFSKERLLEDLGLCKIYDGIDAGELADKLAELAEIGRTEEGGVTRLPYTDEEKKAKQLFKGWMNEAGLVTKEDAIGNLFGRLEGESPELPVVLTGSHIDSVPNGGAFDGPLGCISSLLALKAVANTGVKPKRSIEMVVFVDEEGARFGNGLFGSRVIMGEVEAEDLRKFEDNRGVVSYDAMSESGYTPENIDNARQNPEDIYAFLELHIEQGKRLEGENKQIGVVNGIAGAAWITFNFYGETDHAGNTPMENRSDTVAGAAEFILEVEKMPRRYSDTAVATVGNMQVFPNGTNVIAGRTEVVVDARDIDLAARENMLDGLKKAARDIAKKRGLTVEIMDGIKISPVLVPDRIREMIKSIAEDNGLGTMDIPSGAGHDAMIMGKFVPSGMIFVPSHNGKSHSPEEWTSLPDCVNGVQVLKESLLELANE